MRKLRKDEKVASDFPVGTIAACGLRIDPIEQVLIRIESNDTKQVTDAGQTIRIIACSNPTKVDKKEWHRMSAPINRKVRVLTKKSDLLMFMHLHTGIYFAKVLQARWIRGKAPVKIDGEMSTASDVDGFVL